MYCLKVSLSDSGQNYANFCQPIGRFCPTTVNRPAVNDGLPHPKANQQPPFLNEKLIIQGKNKLCEAPRKLSESSRALEKNVNSSTSHNLKSIPIISHVRSHKKIHFSNFPNYPLHHQIIHCITNKNKFSTTSSLLDRKINIHHHSVHLHHASVINIPQKKTKTRNNTKRDISLLKVTNSHLIKVSNQT